MMPVGPETVIRVGGESADGTADALGGGVATTGGVKINVVVAPQRPHKTTFAAAGGGGFGKNQTPIGNIVQFRPHREAQGVAGGALVQKPAIRDMNVAT